MLQNLFDSTLTFLPSGKVAAKLRDKKPDLHIEHALEFLYFTFCQIQFLIIDAYANANPVGAFNTLAKYSG